MTTPGASVSEQWEAREEARKDTEERWWRREMDLLHDLHAHGRLDEYLRAQQHRRLSFTGHAIGEPEHEGPFWVRLYRVALIATGLIRSRRW